MAGTRPTGNGFRLWLFLLVSAGLFSTSWGSVFAEQTAIRVLTWSTGAAFDQEKELYLGFNSVQDKIKVELEAATGNIQEKATIMMVTGTAPDIIMTHQNWHWEWANANMVLDLTPLIERDMDFAWFPPGAFDPYLDNEGRITALPLFIATRVTVYNRGLFDAAGLAYPDDNTTLLGGIVDAARKITRDTSGDGVPDYWGMVPAYLVNIIWRFWGATYLTPQRDAFALNNEIGLASLGFLRDLYATWEVAPNLSSITSQARTRWARGNVGMTWSNQLEALTWSHNMPEAWDIAMLPIGPSGKRAVDIASWGFTIPANAPNPEAAWEFLKWLMTPEMQEELLQYGRAGIRSDVLSYYYQQLDPLKPGYNITPGSYNNRDVIYRSFVDAPYDFTAGLPLPNDVRGMLENTTVPLPQVLSELETRVNAALQERGMRK